MSAAMPPPAPCGPPVDPAWLCYPPGTGYDEAFGPAGVRAHWGGLLGALAGLGLAALKNRWAEAQHLIRQNGVTYNVYRDPRGLARPWQLDPVPMLLEPGEAETLATGLTQRARLLEALLRDLYGPQRTLSAGLLPPELVFGNPAYLRPLHGIKPPGSRYLHLYAANVARDASGYFWVMGDRSQSPSGAGYALENRIVQSRMLPDAFRECGVQRLAPFFRNLCDTLQGLAPRRRDNPRVVLLTPGPYNETYFEHAYLARYLGFPLVEGGDLTVRDNGVYLKVLGGLQPVDVIFRRLDDDFCDPLELRHDSFLGVPGLVQAVRSGTVAVANALGSGLLETPALLAFLPGLCRQLLGEELLLHSAPTWWCGQRHECEYVLAHLSQMVIKPARPSLRLEPTFGGELSRSRREELSAKIRAAPGDYIGQQPIQLATAPVLLGDRFEPRHVVMRMYLGARDDSFCVMPGGLTRVAASPGSMVVSMQSGGLSKDTWMLSHEPVSLYSMLRPDDEPVELSRGGDLPSRVADNLFWLGRYAGRAEGLMRLLRVVLGRLPAASALGEAPELPALLQVATYLSDGYPGFVGAGSAARLASPEQELFSIVHDASRPGSLAGLLSRLGGVAATVRDRISPDMWRVLNDLSKTRRPHGLFPGPGNAAEDHNGSAAGGNGLVLGDELNLLDRAVLVLAAFGGLAVESVPRNDGWSFLTIGRKLEQALQLVTLVENTLVRVSPPEAHLLEALLDFTDTSMTYRRRYQSHLQAAAVLDLLLADETNPRSMVFLLSNLTSEVDRLPRNTPHPGSTAEQRLTLAALTVLRLADPHELAVVAHGRRPVLEELLGRLRTPLLGLSDSLTRRYLSHLQISRHLSSSTGRRTEG
jgi:uncharacterized circularly permuted ATP-grasp superfamily protein/uncharacterized alpha-E superfamily protein